MKRLFQWNKLALFMLSSLTFAATSLAKTELNLMFIGKTGSGKSTSINTIYNIINGAKYNDDKKFVIPLLHHNIKFPVNVESCVNDAPGLSSRGRSQTDKIRKYTVENHEFIVNMYDSPGFLDTSLSPLKDAQICDSILNKLATTPIDTIVIVIEASSIGRETPEFYAWVDLLQRTLPKAVHPAIVGLYTHVIFDSDSYPRFHGNVQSISRYKTPPIGIENKPLFAEETASDAEREIDRFTWEENEKSVDQIIRITEFNHSVSNHQKRAEEISSFRQNRADLIRTIEDLQSQQSAYDKQLATAKDLCRKRDKARSDCRANREFMIPEVRYRRVNSGGVGGMFRDAARGRRQEEYIEYVPDEYKRRKYFEAEADFQYYRSRADDYGSILLSQSNILKNSKEKYSKLMNILNKTAISITGTWYFNYLSENRLQWLANSSSDSATKSLTPEEYRRYEQLAKMQIYGHR